MGTLTGSIELKTGALAMDFETLPDNPYFLLTPGPLSTTKTVKAAMLRDWCTWDDDYNSIVQDIRDRLVRLATCEQGYTSVLMQGSGTFSVEATIGTAVPRGGKLLVIANGAYGQRIAQIARYLEIELVLHDSGEVDGPDAARIEEALDSDSAITTVAVVHCETTTGMLNPIHEIGRIVKGHDRTYIVDAMSSFGGYVMDMADIGADFLISSANKCIQGVPGFGFVVAGREVLESCKGNARSLSLDLFDQWEKMEQGHGKWRYTSPTHVVRAFSQALQELDDEGGIAVRAGRYAENHSVLVDGMSRLGFRTLIDDNMQSHIITSFHNPAHTGYEFKKFYNLLKEKGFVIYPGKVSVADCFRVGNIGHVFPADIHALIEAVRASMYWEADAPKSVDSE